MFIVDDDDGGNHDGDEAAELSCSEVPSFL